MKKICLFIAWSIVFSAIIIIPFNSNGQDKVKPDKHIFGEIEARHIGPAVMSGRISCIDAVEKDPKTVYVGTAGGGIWKSDNAATTFDPIFDKHNQCIGTITIDQNHPDTVWVGTGEVWVRNSVSVGDGIYKTTDGGEKWKNMGLKNSERISRIIIHPDHPDTVYVGVLGNLWDESDERGVYKTTDGGQTWEKILYVDENTGCADMAMDPENPDIILSGMWDFRRKPYFFRSGGPGSGLYQTSNGGQSWNRIENNLPDTTIGRIALTFSCADTNLAFALVESEKSGLYRSADKGESWELVSDNPILGHRPFYFAYIVADPVEANRIYKPGFSLHVSDDYGEHFVSPFIGGGNVHSDIHAMWIDPNDNNFIYMGTDGGLYISHDKGNTWKFVRNLPVSTFYHVQADDQKPYFVYGGLQDNGSWMAPSKNAGAIGNKNWDYIGYGDGFNVFPDNEDNNIVYFQSQGGNINRKYLNTNESKNIKPFEDDETEKLRFNWNTPIIQSSKTNTLFVGAQYLFKSSDKGDTWIRISPDLTTNNQEKLRQEETGGLTLDNSTAENHCTIFAIAESPLDTNIIWVGTDDGNLYITKNAGKKWKNLIDNIPDLPKSTWCSSIEPSRYDKETIYVTFDGHRQGDKKPYIYKTTDNGKSWISLADKNIEGYCHIILEDPVNPNLLFLGTEFGLYISIDGGKTWTKFQGKVPDVSARDMVIQERENDLVMATHGRGILIIDDITPIRNLTPELLDKELVFLPSRPFELSYLGYSINHQGDDEFIGPNPSGSVQITYYLKKRHIFGDMNIEIYSKDGKLIKTMPAGKRKGINRVSWQMYKKPPKVPSSVQLLGQAFVGPPYPPGKYTVKVNKGDNTYEGEIRVIYDTASPHSFADRDLRLEILTKAYDLLEKLAFIDAQVIDIRNKTKNKAKETDVEKLKSNLNELSNRMDSIRKEILATKQGRVTGEIKLREKIAKIYGNVMGYQGRPTNNQIERLDDLVNEVNILQEQLNHIVSVKIKDLNQELQNQGVDPLKIITYDEFMKDK